MKEFKINAYFNVLKCGNLKFEFEAFDESELLTQYDFTAIK